MNQPVLEVVLMKLNPGVSDAAFEAAAAAIQPQLTTMSGYIRRELFKNADGQWVDLVWWRSMDEALKAMDVMNARPEARSFGAMIDFANTNMLHLNAVRAWS